MSDGYGAYLELWPKLFRGELPEVSASQWRALITKLVREEGEAKYLRTMLECQIEHAWRINLATVARIIDAAGGDDFVNEELSLHSEPKDVAQRLVVLSAATKLGLIERRNVQFDLPYSSHQPAASKTYDVAGVADLSKAATAKGISIVLVDLLLAGITSDETAKLTASGFPYAKEFIGELPTQLLEKLATSCDWVHNSWLTCELARRRH